MRPQSKRPWCWTVVGVALLGFAAGASDAQAQKNADSGEFTLKVTYDPWWWDGETDQNFSATGAIRDKGTFEQTGYYEDETGNGYQRFTFYGAHGTFSVKPFDDVEGVELPAEVLPGTGKYADISGVGVVTLRIRWRNVQWYDPMFGRVRYTYPVYTWTVDGVLLP